MRLRTVAESWLERLVLKLNQVPEPLIETQMAFNMARTIMTGVKLGVFEAMAEGPAPALQVASLCQCDAAAMEKLLNTLVACNYLRWRRDGYVLTPKSRKWLLRRSPHNLCDKMLFQFYEWDIVSGYEEYVRTGKSVTSHASVVEDDYWSTYQRGMYSLARLWAKDVAARCPVPAGARDLLDIGGSHGYYSVCLCQRYPRLNGVILDLPNAVKYAAPLLAAEGMGNRITHRAEDVLTATLQPQSVDVVFMSQLVHHFTDEQNRQLLINITQALRPQGVCVVLDYFGPGPAGKGDQAAALLDLYFATLSASGIWSADTLQDWFRATGLMISAPIRFRNMPGGALVVGVKG